MNCPYDRSYRLSFWAQIFAIYDCGFFPQAAMAINDATVTRLERIFTMVSQSPYSVHDLRLSDRARFNMPFELGVAMGIARSDTGSNKHVGIFVTDQKKYERACSDLKGIDPNTYNGTPTDLARAIAKWLNHFKRDSTSPGAQQVAQRFSEFEKLLPAFAKRKGFEVENADWSEMNLTVHTYLQRNPPVEESAFVVTGLRKANASVFKSLGVRLFETDE